ncbi:hypothetical protein AWC11_07205 [Mycobacterium interjectum]|nr:hypothetical protein AWC11_07205 [Mycobacterium interjectum]
MGALDWLSDRSDPRVAAALGRRCSICRAQPGADCRHPFETKEPLAEIAAAKDAQADQIAAVSTSWTADEIAEYVRIENETAERWLTAESIESASCKHRLDGGDCGDPVCRVQRATALSWMSYMNMLDSDRSYAVMDAAEELLDA